MFAWRLLTCSVLLVNHLCYSNPNENCECGVANEEEINFRIINGKEAMPHSLPWSVYLTYNGQMYCGGAIISDKYVLTAGHCVYGLKKELIHVMAGGHDTATNPGTKFTVSAIKLHPNFFRHEEYDDNDIALIRIHGVFEYDGTIRPICLPDNVDLNRKEAVIAGWGITERKSVSNVLMKSRVRIWSDNMCQKADVIGPKYRRMENICAYGDKTDTCQGDSGSSMMYEVLPYKYQTVGVVSWGSGCAPKGIPGVYANVAYYVPWILSKTQDSSYCKK